MKITIDQKEKTITIDEPCVNYGNMVEEIHNLLGYDSKEYTLIPYVNVMTYPTFPEYGDEPIYPTSPSYTIQELGTSATSTELTLIDPTSTIS